VASVRRRDRSKWERGKWDKNRGSVLMRMTGKRRSCYGVIKDGLRDQCFGKNGIVGSPEAREELNKF